MNSPKTVLFSLLTLASCMCNGMEPENLNNALVEACLVGDLNAAQLLVESGASVNAKDEYGNTPLHRVIRTTWIWNENPKETVRFLIDNKANICAHDKGTFPVHAPLYWAIFMDKTDITKVLIDHGAIFDPHSLQFRVTPDISQDMRTILKAAIEQQKNN